MVLTDWCVPDFNFGFLASKANGYFDQNGRFIGQIDIGDTLIVLCYLVQQSLTFRKMSGLCTFLGPRIGWCSYL